MKTKRTSYKTNTKKHAIKTSTTSKAPAKKKAVKRTPNPFRNADYVKQTSTNYKVQSVSVTQNGIKVHEKTMKRTPALDKKFNAVKRSRG